MYKLLFYLTIVNKTYVTVTLGLHDSKATSSLITSCPSWVIAKLERTRSTAQQNNDPTQNPTNNRSNNKQQTHRLRTESSRIHWVLGGGTLINFTGQIFTLDSAAVKHKISFVRIENLASQGYNLKKMHLKMSSAEVVCCK